MKIFLIRHAETVHNVGQAWAGTIDSPLTKHGVLQIQRLAQYFVATRTTFKHVFSSDLNRAVATAEGIIRDQAAQQSSFNGGGGLALAPVLIPSLQEQHFGSPQDGVGDDQTEDILTEAETESSMRARCNTFLNDYLLPVIFDNGRSNNATTTTTNIAIVAHGTILRVLWDCLTQFFSPADIQFSPEVESELARWGDGALVPFWSNTGFMELSVNPHPKPKHITDQISGVQSSIPSNTTSLPPLTGWSMTVLSIDSKPHLTDLRRMPYGLHPAV